MDDVLAPESTLALMAGISRSSKLHHSSLPIISRLSTFIFLILYLRVPNKRFKIGAINRRRPRLLLLRSRYPRPGSPPGRHRRNPHNRPRHNWPWSFPTWHLSLQDIWYPP